MEKKKKFKFRKKHLKWVALLLALFVLIGAACYTVFIQPMLNQEEWVYIESTVERGTLQVGVTESGSLEYGISYIYYDLDLDMSASSDDDDDEESTPRYLEVEEVYVATGERIEEGEELIKFTEESIESVRKLLENALIDAKSDYNEAEAEYNLSVLEAETTYETALLQAQYASEIYSYASSDVDNQISILKIEITQCQEKVASLEEALEEAQESYEEALEAYETACAEFELYGNLENTVNFMTFQNAYLNARTRYQNALSALEQAEENLENNEDQIASLQQELALAQAKRTIELLGLEETYEESILEGENSSITYTATLESLKETLEEAEAEKEEAQERLDAFEEFIGEDGIVYADGSGIVTQVSYSVGDSLEQTGIMVAYAAPTDMTISVDVTQEDVVTFSVGDTVSIAFTAYEDTTWQGTILSVDTTATSSSSNTVSYTVLIGVDGDTTLLYGGMTADITFVTEEVEDTLYVSRKAIVEENNKTYVYIQNEEGEMELTEVETGLSNTSSIEILSGLSEGDVIYIASKVSSTEAVEDTDSDSTMDADSLDLDSFDFDSFDMDDFNMDGFDTDSFNRNGGSFDMPGGTIGGGNAGGDQGGSFGGGRGGQ